jgi:hypothetical protein
MRKSTINLTKKELLFASDTFYPITKQKVLRKISSLMDNTAKNIYEAYQNKLLFYENEGFIKKLSKGENYKEMPYLVIDTPQINGPGFKTLFRIVFWWGHYFTLNYYVHRSMIADYYLHSWKKTYLCSNMSCLWENDLRQQEFIRLASNDKRTLTLSTDITYLRLVRKVKIDKADQLNQIGIQWMAEISDRIGIKKA